MLQPSTPDFREFVGLDRCTVNPSEVFDRAHRSVLFLQWRHVAENVRMITSLIEDAIEKNPGVRNVVICEECTDLDRSEKHMLEHHVATILNAPRLEAERTLRALQRDGIGPRELSLIRGVREAIWVGGQYSSLSWDRDASPPRIGSVRYLDSETTADIAEIASAKTALEAQWREIDSLMERSVREVRLELLCRPRAWLDSTSWFVQRISKMYDRLSECEGALISHSRNDRMAQQITAVLDSLPEESLVVVLIGAAHAEVPFRLGQPLSSVEYVQLPEEFLDMLAPSARHQVPFSPQLCISMLRASGESPTEDEHTRACFDALLQRYVKTMASTRDEGSMLSHPAVQLYVVRTIALMTDIAEIRGLLHQWSRRVVSHPFYKGRRVSDALHDVLQEWLEREYPQSGGRYREVADAVVQRYLAVGMSDM
jgi:hypothetical protein